MPNSTRDIQGFLTWFAAHKRHVIFGTSIVLAGMLLAGCGNNGEATPTPEGTPTPIVVATPTPLPPPKALTICLGEEPNTLYPYGNPNAAARSVMEALFDGPIDTNSYGFQAVILQKLPNIDDGDAQLAPVDVLLGDLVVDTSDNLVALDAGVTVFPSGCTSEECAIEYDGVSPLQMDQLSATFSILPGVTWSDGTPVTANDSVFAFETAKSSDTPGSKFAVDRTQAYEALDETTTQWTGVPGFIDPTYYVNFWTPLPSELLLALTPAEMLTAESTATHPLGWGPFVLDEWISGDHISLSQNPNYFRAAEGLPHATTVTYRFVADPDTAISQLLSGECDLLDTSVRLDGQVDLLLEFMNSGQTQSLFSTTMVMERLDFGILPASYDDGYTPGAGGDRPDFFSDPLTRQAIAMCLDRQAVVDSVLFGLSAVPDTYIPAEHPLYNPSVPPYTFDVAAAGELLDQVGWADDDDDPSTPRQSLNVAGVPNGTPFVVNYTTTVATQRRQVSEILAQSLGQCGIQLNLQYMQPEEFYAAGPDGPLFGRQFDLAEFAMSTTGSQPPCDWWTTDEIPTADNLWIGANVSGYSSEPYDTACRAALTSLPDTPEFTDGNNEAEFLFSQDLPVVPLYWRIIVAAARSDMCNFALDPTASSDLWNIEQFDYGDTCLP
jgi:peptide/nickel transport system substrate-binding protein